MNGQLVSRDRTSTVSKPVCVNCASSLQISLASHRPLLPPNTFHAHHFYCISSAIILTQAVIKIYIPLVSPLLVNLYIVVIYNNSSFPPPKQSLKTLLTPLSVPYCLQSFNVDHLMAPKHISKYSSLHKYSVYPALFIQCTSRIFRQHLTFTIILAGILTLNCLAGS